MKDQKDVKLNLPKNSSPVCYQNGPDIQEEYLLHQPKIKNSIKANQAGSKNEDQ